MTIPIDIRIRACGIGVIATSDGVADTHDLIPAR
jgi:hypothetical protein